jgi:hypothetical protein
VLIRKQKNFASGFEKKKSFNVPYYLKNHNFVKNITSE